MTNVYRNASLPPNLQLKREPVIVDNIRVSREPILLPEINEKTIKITNLTAFNNLKKKTIITTFNLSSNASKNNNIPIGPLVITDFDKPKKQPKRINSKEFELSMSSKNSSHINLENEIEKECVDLKHSCF